MLAGEKKKWAIFEEFLPVFRRYALFPARSCAREQRGVGGPDAGRDALMDTVPPFPAGQSQPLWQAGVTDEVGLLHEGHA